MERFRQNITSNQALNSAFDKKQNTLFRVKLYQCPQCHNAAVKFWPNSIMSIFGIDNTCDVNVYNIWQWYRVIFVLYETYGNIIGEKEIEVPLLTQSDTIYE